MSFPVHPVPSMQASFEESMLDAAGETGFVAFGKSKKNVETRRLLLCKKAADAPASEWNFTYNCHWRSHSTGDHHPLLKTIAQIAFGIHLLHQHLEKSVADVADILLKHVHELDSFLHRANGDIESSMKDMLFRRKCLRVPMKHVREFDRLLDDRLYRAQLLDGNVTIERTVNRMSELLDDYYVDMTAFRDANIELDRYLSCIGDAWMDENDDVARIYVAMCGNTSGWAHFLQDLAGKAEQLGHVLVEVSSFCREIETRCAAASQRSLVRFLDCRNEMATDPIAQALSRSASRRSASKDTPHPLRGLTNSKPLPGVPNERPVLITLSSHGDSSEDTPPPSRHRQRGIAKSTSRDSALRDPPAQSRGPREAASMPDGTRISRRSSEGRSPLNDPTKPHEESSSSDDADGADESDGANHTDECPEHSPKHLERAPKRGVAGLRLSGATHQRAASPPLTGKDSAYWSTSAASTSSPVAQQPRSPSSLSSHQRPNLGLFPSSAPGTPRSVLSRSGTVSPPARAPARLQSPVQPPPTTHQAAPAAPPQPLRRKTSLSYIRRFFSKRKHVPADTIVE